MKNIGIKTIILFVVIFMAVGGVLAFLPTIFQPPVEVEPENLYVKTIDADIDKLSFTQMMEQNDSLYELLKDKVALYLDEELMAAENVDERTLKFVGTYVSIFAAYSDSKFLQSTWYSNDHVYMKRQIADLEQLRLADGRPCLDSEQNGILDSVKNVIRDYDGALALLNNHSQYVSREKTLKNLEKKEKYKSNLKLQNCDSIKNALDNYPKVLGASHYGIINSRITSLGKFKEKNWGPQEFRKERRNVEKMIDEYELMCDKYIDYQAANGLRTLVTPITSSAMEYFERNVYPDAWSQITTSTNQEYDEYTSTSSYYDKQMRVDFQGCKKYTVRIKAQDRCAVMIALNRMPTINDNDRIVTGTGRYTDVTFDNLSKRKNTIYIVSCSDLNGYYGGAGYVMIPKSVEN